MLRLAEKVYHFGSIYSDSQRFHGVGEEFQRKSSPKLLAIKKLITATSKLGIPRLPQYFLTQHSKKQQIPFPADIKVFAFGGQSSLYRFRDLPQSNKVVKIFKADTLHFYSEPGRLSRVDTFEEKPSITDLESTVDVLRQEVDWYREQFRDIPSLRIPEQNFFITTDPLRQNLPTIALACDFIPGVLKDPFFMSDREILELTENYPGVATDLACTYDTILGLDHKGIAIDIRGYRNLSVNFHNNQASLVLIDPFGASYTNQLPIDILEQLDIYYKQMTKTQRIIRL